MPEVRIGPDSSAGDRVPRGSDGRSPYLMTGTDNASGWYISHFRDWLFPARKGRQSSEESGLVPGSDPGK